MPNNLLQAEQQLTGYSHAKQGYGIESLVDSMGLTKDEWMKLCKQNRVSFLSIEDKIYIDEYFIFY
jgi:hypothetical protein